MSLGWSSFVTGFAKQATTLIQERDKEIQSLIDERLEEMNRSAKEARTLGASRKEELTSVSNTLISLGVPESEVASIIETQGIERAKQTAEILQKRELTGGLTPARIQQMTAGLPEATGSLEDTVKRLSTPMRGEVPPVQMQRAFGLGGGRRAAAFEERAGRIATELPEMPRATAGGGLDLSVFAEEDEETFTKRESAARMKILDAETDEERQQGLNELNRILAIKDIGKDKEDNLKESDVRSNLRILDATIKQSIAGPGDLVVVTDPATGERTFEYSKDIDPKVRNEIERKRREEFRKYIRQHYEESGKVPDVVQRVTSAFLLGGTSPDKERLRADANQKIAQNPAIADQVRAEFKRLTGEDL